MNDIYSNLMKDEGIYHLNVPAFPCCYHVRVVSKIIEENEYEEQEINVI